MLKAEQRKTDFYSVFFTFGPICHFFVSSAEYTARLVVLFSFGVHSAYSAVIVLFFLV